MHTGAHTPSHPDQGKAPPLPASPDHLCTHVHTRSGTTCCLPSPPPPSPSAPLPLCTRTHACRYHMGDLIRATLELMVEAGGKGGLAAVKAVVPTFDYFNPRD